MKNPTTLEIFNEAFEQAPEIPFAREWSNGTGYFDHAVFGEFAPKVGNGKMVRAVTPGLRRILIIGTRIGNVVIFTRYDNWAQQEEPVFMFNTTSLVSKSFCMYDGPIEAGLMEELVGFEAFGNIGQRIEDVYAGCKRSVGM